MEAVVYLLHEGKAPAAHKKNGARRDSTSHWQNINDTSSAEKLAEWSTSRTRLIRKYEANKFSKNFLSILSAMTAATIGWNWVRSARFVLPRATSYLPKSERYPPLHMHIRERRQRQTSEIVVSRNGNARFSKKHRAEKENWPYSVNHE